jgi:hypothetical protein
MIRTYQHIHFEGPIADMKKRVNTTASGARSLCLDLDGEVALYFEDASQIPQLIAQLAELHVMATAQAPVEDRVDVIRGAA